ncbi:MAG TPA: ABC transporter ATP-binding protein [Deltaproteobacteria bacterium]|nr:ABC transporter ATP-binding protein [Deltaproteobacteria bacterium]
MERHRAAYLLCALGLFASSLSGLLVPWMIREAIDSLSRPGGAGGLVRAVSWMLLFAALHAGFRYVSRRGLLITARHVELELRHDLFSHVIRLPVSFFGRTATGDVMSRLTNDISAIWLFLGPGILTLTGTAISYLLALAFMVRISPVLTAVALVLAPAVVLLSRSYGKAFHRLHRKGQESFAAMNSLLQENITGIRLVKTYGLEEREERRFRGSCEEYYRVNVSVSKTSAAFHGGIGFLAGGGVALVLLLGGWLVIRGQLTLGGFVAFNAYLAMLSFPTMALGWVINLFQRAGSATGRIHEFLATPSEPEEAGPAEPPPHGREVPLLEIRDLSFLYEGETRGETLRGVTFSVGPGEVVGLVGQTGSGKSTLLSLILRLYPAPPGKIFLRGRDAAGIPLAELRRSIRLVAQDPFLFSDTVLENICFGLEKPDAEAARRAASLARLLAEIEEMPAGMDTVIGERGLTLSGGQKQRAAVARALCAGGELLLLDDILSAVDSETEREIFEGILSLRGERTVLFSTHRMASLSRCDRVLVMREGRIVEQGTHEQLFALGGEYFDLYSRQMLVRELEASP